MGILIDSSVLIHFERTRTNIAQYVHGRETEEIYLSVISASELLHGFHRADNHRIKAKRHAFVESIIGALPILDIDVGTARTHAQLWAHLMKQGEMIGSHDLWLAATCITYGLKLATFNTREFKRIPGLDLENWK